MEENPWSIVFYTTERGNCPVKEFLIKLPHVTSARMSKGIALLSSAGFRLGPPWLKKIDDALWELRAIGENLRIRIRFSQEGPKFVLLHAMKKKQQKLSRRDIEIAHQRLEDYRVRFK